MKFRTTNLRTRDLNLHPGSQPGAVGSAGNGSECVAAGHQLHLSSEAPGADANERQSSWRTAAGRLRDHDVADGPLVLDHVPEADGQPAAAGPLRIEREPDETPGADERVVVDGVGPVLNFDRQRRLRDFDVDRYFH